MTRIKLNQLYYLMRATGGSLNDYSWTGIGSHQQGNALQPYSSVWSDNAFSTHPNIGTQFAASNDTPIIYGASNIGANHFDLNPTSQFLASLNATSINIDNKSSVPRGVRSEVMSNEPWEAFASISTHTPHDHVSVASEPFLLSSWNAQDEPLSLTPSQPVKPKANQASSVLASRPGAVQCPPSTGSYFSASPIDQQIPKVRRCKPFSVNKKSEQGQKSGTDSASNRQLSVQDIHIDPKLAEAYKALFGENVYESVDLNYSRVQSSFGKEANSIGPITMGNMPVKESDPANLRFSKNMGSQPLSTYNTGATDDGAHFSGSKPGDLKATTAKGEGKIASKMAASSEVEPGLKATIVNTKSSTVPVDDLLPVKSYCKFSCPNFFMSSPDCARCKFYNLSSPQVDKDTIRNVEPHLKSVPEAESQAVQALIFPSSKQPSTPVNIMDLIGVPGVSIVSQSSLAAPMCTNSISGCDAKVANFGEQSGETMKPANTGIISSRKYKQVEELETFPMPEDEVTHSSTGEQNNQTELKEENTRNSNQVGELDEDTKIQESASETTQKQIATEISCAKIIRYTREELMKFGEGELCKKIPDVSDDYKEWLEKVVAAKLEPQSTSKMPAVTPEEEKVELPGCQDSNGAGNGEKMLAHSVCKKPFATTVTQKRVCTHPMFRRALQQAVSDK